MYLPWLKEKNIGGGGGGGGAGNDYKRETATIRDNRNIYDR